MATQTGFANVGDEGEINAYLKQEPEAADQTLVEMTHIYGHERLE